MLTDTERTLCEQNKIDLGVAEMIKTATKQPLVQLRDTAQQEVEGIASSSTENEAVAIVENLQPQVPANHQLFYSARGLSEKAFVAVLRNEDPMAVLCLQGTGAGNYDLDNDAIITRLREWQAKSHFVIIGASHDWVALRFETLPNDLASFTEEIYEFCPDVIDQHYGCFGEMAEALEESGQNVPEAMRELMQDLDWSDEGEAGLELLQRALRRDQRLFLWWD